MLYPRLNETQTQLGRTPPQVAVGLRPRLKRNVALVSETKFYQRARATTGRDGTAAVCDRLKNPTADNGTQPSDRHRGTSLVK